MVRDFFRRLLFGEPYLRPFRDKLINLIAAAAVSATAVAAPIDAKTEHLGLRLGSMRSELNQANRRTDIQAHYEFQFVKPPAGMETPSLEGVPISFSRGATFGDYPIYRVTGFYLSDILCSLRFEFQPYFTGNEARDNELRRRVEAVAEGLKEKYGPPTEVPPSVYDQSGQAVPDYRKMAVWEGDDIKCYFFNVPSAPVGSRFDSVSVTLESKSAFKKAEEQAIHHFEAEESRMKQKSKELRNDL